MTGRVDMTKPDTISKREAIQLVAAKLNGLVVLDDFTARALALAGEKPGNRGRKNLGRMVNYLIGTPITSLIRA